MSADLNISLRPHVVDALRPLRDELPHDLQSQLHPFLTEPIPPTIPYSILSRISQWSRSDSGRDALQHVGRDAADYTMISLLAGATTSPEKNFGPYTPPKEPHVIANEQKLERRAITAIVNGLVSIFATGMAVWWASDKTGFRDEWRVLLSFAAATVVACSEVALYIIWQARLRKAKLPKDGAPRRVFKKDRTETNTDIATAGASNAIEPRAVELRERVARLSHPQE
ncbi:Endoplasmic reticulum-based factor for assembly of V-ATPase [Pleurotus pulmonarius]